MSLYARGKLKATVKSGRCANWGYWLRLPLPAHAGVDVPKSAYKNDGDNDRGGAHALIAMACCIGGKEREFGSCSRSALLFARRSAASMKLIHTHTGRQQCSMPVYQYEKLSAVVVVADWSRRRQTTMRRNTYTKKWRCGNLDYTKRKTLERAPNE